jgi:hypothetical protein
MALRKMMTAFIACSDEEARYVSDLLVEAGIKAKVTDSFPWEVWIENVDAERAKPVLDEYLRRGDEWRAATWLPSPIMDRERAEAWYAAQRSKGLLTTSEESIEVACEECGKSTKFPAVLRGTAEECPHCGATVDVGDDADPS